MSPSCLPLSLPEPELAREDAEDGVRRLLEENRRLKDENGGLGSAVSLLRARVEKLSVAAAAFGGTISEPCAAAMAIAASSTPGSPADGQRPATPSPEEEISGTVLGGGKPTGLSFDAVGAAVIATTASAERRAERQEEEEDKEEEDGDVAATDGPSPTGAGRLEVLELAVVAPSSSSAPTFGERRLSPTTARFFGGAGGTFGADACSKSAGSTDGGRGVEHGEEDRGGEEETRRREKAEIQRVIEEEAERVYLELRANPPPEIKALLAARQEMDEISAVARSTLRDLNSSGVLAGWQQQQQQQSAPPPPLD